MSTPAVVASSVTAPLGALAASTLYMMGMQTDGAHRKVVLIQFPPGSIIQNDSTGTLQIVSTSTSIGCLPLSVMDLSVVAPMVSDPTTKTITIGVATESVPGSMSAADKTRLDSLFTGTTLQYLRGDGSSATFPTLGTAAAQNASAFATAAQGTLAASSLQAIAIGTVSTGTADVTTSTTGSTSTLNFTVPQGTTGATGAKGDTGSAGAQGSTGATGATGAAGAQGIQGATGSTGAAGSAGATGSAGSTGAQGATGATGSDGAQGPSGTVAVNAPITNSGTSSAANLSISASSSSSAGSMSAADKAKLDTLNLIGGFPIETILTTSTSYTITTNDEVIRVTAACTITLPTAVGISGKRFRVKSETTGTVVVATTSSQTIDGQAGQKLTALYMSLNILSNGTNWDLV